MDLTFDLARQILVQKAGASAALTRQTVVRGDDQQVRIRFVSGSSPAELTGDMLTMVFVSKQSVSLTAAVILLANEFVFDSEAGAWVSPITQNLSALEDIMGSATGIDLLAEFTFSTTTIGATTSQVFALRVTNDLWKGNEGTPLSLPSPDEWFEGKVSLRETLIRTAAQGPPISGPEVTGVRQVETMTIVAPAGVTTNMTVNASFYGPFNLGTVNIPVVLTTAAHTTDVLIAEAYKQAYEGSLVFQAAGWTVTRSGAVLTFTRTTPLANDTLANFFTTGWSGIGIADAPNSVNTTLGAAPVNPTVAKIVGQLCRVGDSDPYQWYRAKTLTTWEPKAEYLTGTALPTTPSYQAQYVTFSGTLIPGDVFVFTIQWAGQAPVTITHTNTSSTLATQVQLIMAALNLNPIVAAKFEVYRVTFTNRIYFRDRTYTPTTGLLLTETSATSWAVTSPVVSTAAVAPNYNPSHVGQTLFVTHAEGELRYECSSLVPILFRSVTPSRAILTDYLAPVSGQDGSILFDRDLGQIAVKNSAAWIAPFRSRRSDTDIYTRALAAKMLAEINTALVGKSAATDMALFTGLTNATPTSNTTFTHNTTCWLHSLRSQLCGFHMGAGAWGYSYSIMPLGGVGSRFALGVQHNGPGPGETVRYPKADGGSFSTTVVAKFQDSGPLADFAIYVLAAPFPVGVSFIPIGIFDVNPSAMIALNPPTVYISQGNPTEAGISGQALCPQNRKCAIRTWIDRTAGPGLMADFFHVVSIGDSNCPDYVMINGKLYLYKMNMSNYAPVGTRENMVYLQDLVNRAAAANSISPVPVQYVINPPIL